MARKKKTIAGLVNDAAKIIQKIVRMKAADEDGYTQCVTCGVTKHWRELQGGHFISRVHTIHKLSEENVHPQCQRCNGFLHGNYIPYTTYMIDMYGRDYVDELHRTKLDVKKYNRCEIEDIIKDLKEYEKQILESL